MLFSDSNNFNLQNALLEAIDIHNNKIHTSTQFKPIDLINTKDEDLIKYRHNLDVVNDEEIQGNAEIKNILNKKYYEIYEDYINSKEFKVDEINRLNRKGMTKDYINRYVRVAKNFIKFFSE